MSPIPSFLLLADLFDRLRLQLPDPIVNWLTPVWILCVGAAAGLILTALLWGILWLISRIPGVASLSDRPANRRVAIGILTDLHLLGLCRHSICEPTRPKPLMQLTPPRQPQKPPLNPRPQPRLPSQSTAPGRSAVASSRLGCSPRAIVILARPKALAETNIALREGVLWPLLITALVMAGCSLFGLFIVRKPMDLLDSLARWPVLAIEARGDVRRPARSCRPDAFDEPAEQILDVQFRRDEIQALAVNKRPARSRPLRAISARPPIRRQMLSLDVPASESKVWRRAEASSNPFRQPVVTKLYAKNLGNGAGQRHADRRSPHRQRPKCCWCRSWPSAWPSIFFAYLLQRAAMPKLAAVALSTAKSDIAQPLYAILMALGIFGLLVFVFIPYNTFGDDIKQLKDSGLSTILVLCVLHRSGPPARRSPKKSKAKPPSRCFPNPSAAAILFSANSPASPGRPA